MTEVEFRQLDARGLQCPLPVLRANKMLRSMSEGEQLRIIATDPSAPADFVKFCDATGHHLVERTTLGDEFHILIRKGS